MALFVKDIRLHTYNDIVLKDCQTYKYIACSCFSDLSKFDDWYVIHLKNDPEYKESLVLYIAEDAK